MKIPELLEDLAIISQLGDNPGSDDGLSAEALKAKFDEAPLKIQKYINTVLIPAVNPAVIPKDYFAPAGYGLGEPEGSAIADLNTTDRNGWFYTHGGTQNVPAFPGGGDYWKYASVYVERRSNIWYQTLKTIWGGKVVIGLRTSTDNGATWGEVEFFNPPMELDVEYRTTERCNGKVVYAKQLNCGSIATSGELQHGIGFTHLVSFFAECKGTFNDAFDKGSGYYFNAWANPYYIWFEAGSSMVSAGGDVYATLKYTKD